MSTYKTRGLVLGTLDLRTWEHDCHRWEGIDSVPAKRGRNRTIPGQRGTSTRPRVAGELSGQLHIWIRGHYDGSAPRAGVLADWVQAAQTSLDTLLDVLDADAPVTLTLHRGGTLDPLSGSCQVEDPGPVVWRLPHLAHMVVGVTLPDGRLEASS